MMKPASLLASSALALTLLFQGAQAKEPFDRRACLRDIVSDAKNYSQRFTGLLPLHGENPYKTRILDADRLTISKECNRLNGHDSEPVHIDDCFSAIDLAAQAHSIAPDGLVNLKLRLRAVENGQCRPR